MWLQVGGSGGGGGGGGGEPQMNVYCKQTVTVALCLVERLTNQKSQLHMMDR